MGIFKASSTKKYALQPLQEERDEMGKRLLRQQEIATKSNEQVNLLRFKVEILVQMMAMEEKKCDVATKRLDALKWAMLLEQEDQAKTKNTSLLPAPASPATAPKINIKNMSSQMANAIDRMFCEFERNRNAILHSFSDEEGRLQATLCQDEFIHQLLETLPSITKHDAEMISLRFFDGNSEICISDFLDFFLTPLGVRRAKAAASAVRGSMRMLEWADDEEDEQGELDTTNKGGVLSDVKKPSLSIASSFREVSKQQSHKQRSSLENILSVSKLDAAMDKLIQIWSVVQSALEESFKQIAEVDENPLTEVLSKELVEGVLTNVCGADSAVLDSENHPINQPVEESVADKYPPLTPLEIELILERFEVAGFLNFVQMLAHCQRLSLRLKNQLTKSMKSPKPPKKSGHGAGSDVLRASSVLSTSICTPSASPFRKSSEWKQFRTYDAFKDTSDDTIGEDLLLRPMKSTLTFTPSDDPPPVKTVPVAVPVAAPPVRTSTPPVAQAKPTPAAAINTSELPPRKKTNSSPPLPTTATATSPRTKPAAIVTGNKLMEKYAANPKAFEEDISKGAASLPVSSNIDIGGNFTEDRLIAYFLDNLELPIKTKDVDVVGVVKNVFYMDCTDANASSPPSLIVEEVIKNLRKLLLVYEPTTPAVAAPIAKSAPVASPVGSPVATSPGAAEVEEWTEAEKTEEDQLQEKIRNLKVLLVTDPVCMQYNKDKKGFSTFLSEHIAASPHAGDKVKHLTFGELKTGILGHVPALSSMEHQSFMGDVQPLFSSDSDPKITLDVLLKYFNDKLAKHKSVEHDIEQWEKTRKHNEEKRHKRIHKASHPHSSKTGGMFKMFKTTFLGKKSVSSPTPAPATSTADTEPSPAVVVPPGQSTASTPPTGDPPRTVDSASTVHSRADGDADGSEENVKKGKEDGGLSGSQSTLSRHDSSSDEFDSDPSNKDRTVSIRSNNTKGLRPTPAQSPRGDGKFSSPKGGDKSGNGSGRAPPQQWSSEGDEGDGELMDFEEDTEPFAMLATPSRK